LFVYIDQESKKFSILFTASKLAIRSEKTLADSIEEAHGLKTSGVCQIFGRRVVKTLGYGTSLCFLVCQLSENFGGWIHLNTPHHYLCSSGTHENLFSLNSKETRY
jgi:hypothetical protein